MGDQPEPLTAPRAFISACVVTQCPRDGWEGGVGVYGPELPS